MVGIAAVRLNLLRRPKSFRSASGSTLGSLNPHAGDGGVEICHSRSLKLTGEGQALSQGSLCDNACAIHAHRRRRERHFRDCLGRFHRLAVAARGDERQARERRKRLRTRSLHDRGAVVFNCALADAKVGRNVLAGLTGKHALHHFALTRRQTGQVGRGRLAPFLQLVGVLRHGRAPDRRRRSVPRDRSAFR